MFILSILLFWWFPSLAVTALPRIQVKPSFSKTLMNTSTVDTPIPTPKNFITAQSNLTSVYLNVLTTNQTAGVNQTTAPIADDNMTTVPYVDVNITAPSAAEVNMTTPLYINMTTNVTMDSNVMLVIDENISLTTVQISTYNVSSTTSLIETSSFVQLPVTTAMEDKPASARTDTQNAAVDYPLSVGVIIAIAAVTTLLSVSLCIGVIYLRKRNKALTAELSGRNVYDVAFSNDIPHISHYDRLDPKTREEVEPAYIYVIRDKNGTNFK